MEDPRVQAMFKRSRHNNISNFSQDYYELGKRTIRCNDLSYFQTKQFQRCAKSLSR